MYERLLDKTITPTFEDLIDYCGTTGALWTDLDKYIKNTFSAQGSIRFPYGSKYGWSMKYSLKNKHICDVFAENGAFSLHFHINNNCLNSIYNELSDYTKAVCDRKYPCGDGGWLTYRVLSQNQLNDVKALLFAKVKQKP